MKKILEKIFPSDSNKRIKACEKELRAIASFEPALEVYTEDDFKKKTEELKARVAGGESLDAVLPEAFALVREASKRVRNERHHDVQLVGGITLHRGGIAEMRTGEGKTLVATLPAYLNALTGKGVHVVTVNDYLARRDAVWMGEVYDFLGLTTSVLNDHASYVYDKTAATKEDEEERDELGSFKIVYDFLKPCSRADAYKADITYGTNSEFGFDFLRDNIAYSTNGIVQRPFNYAIVDEIDSILIDEARTPLIISAPFGDSAELYNTAAEVARMLTKDEDYTVDEKDKAIQLTDEGITKAEKILGIENMYTESGIRFVHHIETAVRAKALFLKDKDYVIKNGEVIIVDEFTGRMQPGRRWSDGLHQAVEAKEGVKIQDESRTLASITYQNFFRFYKKLSGMTGTADTSAEEFLKVYGLEVTTIPTHNPIRRIDHNDLMFQTEHGKFLAIAKKVKELQKKGQPVLVGTVSIEKNEILSDYFKREGIKHEALNAKNHEREAEIISQAGKKGSVVIATNMAGRGVDIKLGGIPTTKEAAEEVIALGGLYVIGTERHEARRIDNQLRGRAGRQGDAGETQFFVSLEDSLMRIFPSDSVKNMMGRFGIPEDEPINSKIVSRSLESAQSKIEGMHFDSRKHVLQFDDVLNEQRKSIYEKRRKILYNDRVYLDEILRDIEGHNEDITKTLEEARRKLPEDRFYAAIRMISLEMIDNLWVDHLEAMEHLRSSVNLRSYGQRDPLVEYKREGLRMFKSFDASFKNSLMGLVPHLEAISEKISGPLVPAFDTTKIEIGFEGQEGKKESTPQSGGEKLGRNDMCHCGSGKKYKKCHGSS
jgi:preprotein translocase subunit SecA